MIKLVLFIVFFIWVVRAPYEHRDSVRDSVWNKDPAVWLKRQEPKTLESFLYACKNYKIGDPRRLKAINNLALIRLQQLHFKDAEVLLELVMIERKPKPGYDEEWTKTVSYLALALDSQQKLDQAEAKYKQLLDYDKEHLPKNDARIGRDYNNLGLNRYLKASSKDRGKERKKLLEESNAFYKQGLHIYQSLSNKDHYVSVVLSNQYLCLLDLGDKTSAHLVKKQIDLLSSKISESKNALPLL